MRIPAAIFLATSLVLMSLAGCGGASGLLGSTLTTPTITSITNPAVRGQTITITGANLNGVNTTAYFNSSSTGVTLQTISASSGGTSSVVVSVPTQMTAGTYNVIVTTSDGTGDGLTSAASNSVTITVN